LQSLTQLAYENTALKSSVNVDNPANKLAKRLRIGFRFIDIRGITRGN
jgi:hypothetical protein